jgi:hypothetical protein
MGARAACPAYPYTLTNGANADANQVMANFNSVVNCLNNLSGSPSNSGRLTYVSTTQIRFAPYNGGQIKINGSVYAIPSAGIAGCTNTNAYVSGVAAQNLAASNFYYVYAFLNGSNITCDFSTTGHATSATAGNVGTEIESGDDTRSLIGMVRTNSSAQFVDSSQQRFVRSWFNRAAVACRATLSANFTATTTVQEVGTGARCEFLSFADETVGGGFNGYSFNNTPGYTYASIGLNGTTPEGVSASYGGNGSSIGMSIAKSGLSEGYNFAMMLAWTSAGTGTIGGTSSTGSANLQLRIGL